MVGNDTPWLASLVGGLPADFDYRVIRSAADARSLVLILAIIKIRKLPRLPGETAGFIPATRFAWTPTIHSSLLIE